MSTKLRISDDLSLPIDAATQTFLIFGKRGSGKSSTATRLAEQMIAGRVPIAVLDPVDVWWGLKAGGSGASDGGLEVYVFGGAHADLPLEPTAGALIADTIVDHRINAVFVLREFSRKDKANFVADFAERLFQRNRSAMHLFCEEAHELMPLKTFGGEEEMLGRMTRLQKLGRTSGIGMTAITQRPASLHTDARTQGEILIAHRIIGPHDRDAIDDWIKYHHVQDERKAVMETLATLKTGECWVWAPEFPEEKPIGLRRVKMLLPETFDSRRTPKPGERAKQPKQLADVDLEKLRSKMAATIERAKADDPKELRKTVATLRADLAKAQRAHPAPAATPQPREKSVEIPVLKDGQLDRAEKLVGRLSDLLTKAGELQHQAKAAVDEVAGAVRKTTQPTAPVPRQVALQPIQPRPRVSPPPAPARQTNGDAAGPGEITPRQQRMLNVAATLTTLGVEVTRETICGWLGIHPRGGSVGEELKALRDLGYVAYEQGRAPIVVTDTGMAAAEQLDASKAIEQSKAGLTERQAKFFEMIVAVYPESITRETIAAQCDPPIHPRGGSLGQDLGRLIGRGLVEGSRGQYRARDFLFATAGVTSGA